MRQKKTVFAALLVAGLASGGFLAAQPADDPADDEPLPEVTASGQTQADLSPREMATEADRIIEEMEAIHVRVLQLQASARKAKDVIKLNCVNERLLAVKQLLNIAEAAQNDMVEAISGGDRTSQVHYYGQVKLASERAAAERDGAEGCIGEEIIFVGPTEVDVDGPDVADDPTDDPNDAFDTVSDDYFERPAYATPFGNQ